MSSSAMPTRALIITAASTRRPHGFRQGEARKFEHGAARMERGRYCRGERSIPGTDTLTNRRSKRGALFNSNCPESFVSFAPCRAGRNGYGGRRPDQVAISATDTGCDRHRE
jgi:hypothetical protein